MLSVLIFFLFQNDPRNNARVRSRLVRYRRTCDSVGCSFWISFFQTMKKYRYGDEPDFDADEIIGMKIQEYKNFEKKKRIRFLEKLMLTMLFVFVVKVLFFTS